jgi:hypothetical protein
MNTLVLPICPGAVPCPDPEEDLTTRLARRFLRERDWSVLAGSDSEDIRRGLAAAGIPAARLERGTPSPYLPAGAAELVGLLAADGSLAPGQAFCLADHRNVNLGPADLHAALRLAESARTCVVSVRKPVDHPIQVRTLTRVLAADLLVLLDPAPGMLPAAAHGRSATRPFFLDLSAVGIQLPKPGRLFALAGDRSVEPAGEDPSSDLFLQMDRCAVLRLLSPDRLVCSAGDLAGISAVLPLENAPGLVLHGPDRGALDIYLRADLLGRDTKLTLAPWRGATAGADAAGIRTVDLPAPEENSLRTVRFSGTEYLGPVATLAAGGTKPDGLVITVRREAPAGAHDLSAPLFRSNQFWDMGQNGEPVLRSTGRPFTGRQDAPPVLELDRALFAGTAADLADLDASLARGMARTIRLDELAGLKIETAFDLLRNEVRLLAAAGTAREAFA